MDQQESIRQRPWTEEELKAAGFQYYWRQKQIVLARELPPNEAPKTIKAPWATLVADAGEIICYSPSYEARPTLDDYDHWPVRREIFEADYAPWDEPDRTTTPAEMHLLRQGCKPYYKRAGVWARRLTKPTYVHSLESTEPVLYPPGAWLLIGSQGEPWATDDQSFRSRYIVPAK